MNPADVEAQARKIWADTFVSHPYQKGDTWVPQKRALAAIEIALRTQAPMPAASGEPVAWMYHMPGDLDHGWQQYEFKRRIQSYEGMSCREEDAGMIETPLYAAPPVQAPMPGEVGELTGEANDHAEAASRWRSEAGEAQRVKDEAVGLVAEYVSLVGNTGYSVDRQGAQELWPKAKALITQHGGKHG